MSETRHLNSTFEGKEGVSNLDGRPLRTARTPFVTEMDCQAWYFDLHFEKLVVRSITTFVCSWYLPESSVSHMLPGKVELKVQFNC
jgi:hypothetical protein